MVGRTRIEGILDKLGRLRERPRLMEWHGATGHHFVLNPPAAESDVAAFEAARGISLPEDYRDFLLLVGNGGVGPYYGIAPLSAPDEWFEEESAWPGFTASPCPFVYEQVTGPNWRQCLPKNDSDWGRGSIHVCDQGCTFTTRLVVSGPSRGRLFNFEAHRQPVPPYFVKDANFIDWYERWLDLALLGEPFWFGYDNPDYEGPEPWRPKSPFK